MCAASARCLGVAAGVAAWLAASPAWGSSIDVHCAQITATERGELQARARLLLSSTGFEEARVEVICDEHGAWLVWTDASRSAIDTSSGIVEGALDAIESRLMTARRQQGQQGGVPAPRTPPSAPPPAAVAATDASRSPTGPMPDAALKPDEAQSGSELSESKGSVLGMGSREAIEGGVGVATTTELWSGSSPLGVGLRVDVGVGIGDQFAVVIGQAARIGLPQPSSGAVTVWDLQAGLAFGAPYRARTGFGLVLLGGAERLALANSGFGSSEIGVWAAIGSLGVRGSVQTGAIDLWMGVDVLVRSQSLDIPGTEGGGVPTVSGSLSLGCFFPAFTHDTTAPVAVKNGAH